MIEIKRMDLEGHSQKRDDCKNNNLSILRRAGTGGFYHQNCRYSYRCH